MEDGKRLKSLFRGSRGVAGGAPDCQRVVTTRKIPARNRWRKDFLRVTSSKGVMLSGNLNDELCDGRFAETSQRNVVSMTAPALIVLVTGVFSAISARRAFCSG